MRTELKLIFPDDSGIKKYNRQVDLISVSLSKGKLFCITSVSQLIHSCILRDPLRLNNESIAKGLTTGNLAIIIFILIPHWKYFY